MKGEWTTCKLSDCCEINPENLKPSWSYSHLRYIDISSVGEGIQTEPFKLIPRADAPSRAQRLVANGDVLLSTVRPNRRSMLWLDTVEKNYVASTGFAVLRAKPEKIVPRFLYYTVFNQVFTDYLVTMEKGAAYPAVNVSDIGDAQIVLPSMAEQKRIASILGALDDKIGLNRRMNAKLEDMARTLFKSWFVDFDPVRAKLDGRLPAGMDANTAALFPDAFEESALGLIPKGWRIGTFSELIEFVIGGDWGASTPIGEEIIECLCIRGADIPSLQSGDLGKMPTRYLKASSIEKRRLSGGDLVIEISGGSPTQCTGRPALALSRQLEAIKLPLAASNFCRVVKLKSKAYSKFAYLWLRLLHESGELFQFETGTTGIKNFGFAIFSQRYPLVIPDINTCKQFDELIAPLLEQLQINAELSRLLRLIRGSLNEQIGKNQINEVL